MGELLRVLVYGSVDAGACDSVRLGVYRDLLVDHGVELRTWGEFNDYGVLVPSEYSDRLEDAIRDGVATADLTPIEWADVLVFRRWYGTVHACQDCDYAVPNSAALAAHCRDAGHAPIVRDRIIRDLLTSIEKDRAVLRGRAMVYELDDDLLSPQPWLASYNRIQGDLDLIERFARCADLVTVTTPVLAARMRRYNPDVRVVRNAVNPEWYEQPGARSEPRPLSFLYYGVAPRLRDYEICREAVDVTSRASGARRIWLGSDAPEVRAVVDQALPYATEVRDFARRLAELRPAIGLAPVGQDNFSRAHSELHWLEYSLAGAATVASRTMGGGPYDVIRDGVDGLLARNKAEWRDKLRGLAGSPQLRTELAGRARERVLAEYDVRQRAAEWADAFRWAADHAGRARLRGLTRGLAAPDVQVRELAVESEARAGLAHRQMVRGRTAQEAETLRRLRGDRETCWPEGAEHDPLVSIVIPTSGQGRQQLERSLASALAQTYENVEVVIVGECLSEDIVAATRAVQDPRVRVENLPAAADEGAVATSNRGLGLARGAWIVLSTDCGELTPDHVETLVSVAIDNGLEFVYGDSWSETPEGPWQKLGVWPPQESGLCGGALLYSAALRYINLDGESWREQETPEWNMWTRMMEAGVRAGHVEHVVFRRHLEAAVAPSTGSGEVAA